jgi:hypothetical protein
MKTKAFVLLAGVIVVAVVCSILYQRHQYKEAVHSLAVMQSMTPGRTQIDEVKRVFGKDSGSMSCLSGNCNFTRSFGKMWLERLIFRKSVSFVVEVSVEEGMVTNTSASLKVVDHDSWVGVAILRSRQTLCRNPGSSCTSVIVGDDRRTPTRVVSRLPADPSLEVKQSAYDFDLRCLLPFCRCATIEDIYPKWKRLPDLPPVVTESRG